jgi:exodeoxyribonuclease V beta subunit
MTESFYFLQYHLYTLALHLYLKYRLADYTYAGHFGGVLYIFLRGVEEGKGIYFDRPQESLIVELEQLLIDK